MLLIGPSLYSKASLKNILSRETDKKLLESIVSSMISRLIRRMCSPLETKGSLSEIEVEAIMLNMESRLNFLSSQMIYGSSSSVSYLKI